MTQTAKEKSTDYLELDRMINEGLGGGSILDDYDKKRYQLKYPSNENTYQRETIKIMR